MQDVQNMSDMYLTLTSRIPVVAQQTHLGRQRLQDAQDAVGLSNESIARKVPVSEKTWRRWKEKGEVPTASLPAVAKALRLELRELSPPDGDLGDRVAEMERHLATLATQVDDGFQETAQTLARLASAIEQLSDVRSGATQRARRRPA